MTLRSVDFVHHGCMDSPIEMIHVTVRIYVHMNHQQQKNYILLHFDKTVQASYVKAMQIFHCAII